MRFVAHDYQKRAIRRILDQTSVGLFLDMGLGKTVITMTAIDELIYDRFEVHKVLVIAPKRVAEDTWTREAAKWDHLQELRRPGIRFQFLQTAPACEDAVLLRREPGQRGLAGGAFAEAEKGLAF